MDGRRRCVGSAMALGLVLALAGCGGAGTVSAPAAKTGDVAIRVTWPDSGRLIPAASNSIKVAVFRSGILLAEKMVTIDRPETTGTIEAVPVGDVTVRATAYPETGAQGVAQATGQVELTVVAGTNDVPTLTMGSTIASVSVADETVGVGDGVQLSATAKDADGQVVLVPTSQPFTWDVTAGSDYLAVDADGMATGLAEGSATVKATEKESGTSGTATVTVNAAAASYVFVTKWGSQGGANGQLYGPYGAAVDADGNVYIADSGNHRIQKFSPTGEWLATWGSAGSGDGQLNNPTGIAVDPDGNVWVGEWGNHRIQKFDHDGNFVLRVGSRGSTDSQFIYTYGVACDKDGNVYVVDNGNFRIQVFDQDGQFLRKWGSQGTGDGQFEVALGVAVDADGNVYVSDRGPDTGTPEAHRVQKFTSTGEFVTKWGTWGTGAGEFKYPHGLAVDSEGNVFVADSGNRRIQKFTGDGVYLTQWGPETTPDGKFDPRSLVIDPLGNVYAPNWVDSRVEKYRPAGDAGDLNFTIN